MSPSDIRIPFHPALQRVDIPIFIFYRSHIFIDQFRLSRAKQKVRVAKVSREILVFILYDRPLLNDEATMIRHSLSLVIDEFYSLNGHPCWRQGIAQLLLCNSVVGKERNKRITAGRPALFFSELREIIALVYLPSALFLFILDEVAITRREIASSGWLFLKGTGGLLVVSCKSPAVRSRLHCGPLF